MRVVDLESRLPEMKKWVLSNKSQHPVHQQKKYLVHVLLGCTNSGRAALGQGSLFVPKILFSVDQILARLIFSWPPLKMREFLVEKIKTART